MRNLLIILMIMPVALLSQSNQSDVFSGGGGFSSAGNYQNYGSFGQAVAGIIQSSYSNKLGFIYTIDFPKPDEVWVSNDYCVGCSNDGLSWEYNCFSDMTHAIRDVLQGGIIIASNAFSDDILNLNEYTLYIGEKDLNFAGTFTGNGYIITNSTGFLIQSAEGNNVPVNFPVGTEEDRYDVEIAYSSDGSNEIKVRAGTSNSIGFQTPTGQIWHIEGPDDLDAVITFMIPKSLFPDGFPVRKYLLRKNDDNWVEYDYIIDDTSSPDHYFLIVTGINEF